MHLYQRLDVLLSVAICFVVIFFVNWRRRRSFLLNNSLTVQELVIMSLSKDDRGSFIKDYFDFKRQNISSIIKGISAIILISVSLIAGHFFGTVDQKAKLPDVTGLIVATAAILLTNLYFLLKLNQTIDEFSNTMNLYERLKNS